ncbi:MAG TPA: FHA domain-containing protein [Rhodothermales bacterium]|nr:FHA domain-containing protein [Rhodothermales bacterium]
MGHRVAALILTVLLPAGLALPVLAQVPAQATTLALRGARTSGPDAAIAFDVRDGRGRSVPGVTVRDLTAQAQGKPVGVASVAQGPPTGTVWVLDATRRARLDRFGQLQSAFANWADSLRRGAEIGAVVAAGRPPRLVRAWTDDRLQLRAAIDNLAPRADEADLPATLRLAAETCRSLPPAARRCAIVLVTDARDLGIDAPGLDSARAVLAAMSVPLYAAVVGPLPRGEAGSDALSRLVGATGGLLVAEMDEVEAVRALRVRLAEGYVAVVSGVPAGQPVAVRLAVRTADGRTLADSATVRLGAPATPSADSSQVPKAANAGSSRWKLWVGLISLLVVAGVAWLLFGRRKEEEAEAPARHEIAEAPAGSAAVLPAAAPEISSPEPSASPVATPSDASPLAAEPAPGVRLHLMPLRTGAAPLRVTVAGTVILGRSGEKADVAVPGDAAISARHVALEQHGQRVLLRDLDSTNGTTVNGVPVQSTVVLAEGDVIRLGQTDLRVRYD